MNTPGTLLQPHELASCDRLAAEQEIRARTRSAYLGDGVSLTLVLGRHKLFIDTSDEGFGAHVILDGFWEIWLTLFCARNLRPGMIAIDVGSHVGYYTLMFSEFVGASGRVLAVEPNPRAARLLQRSINLNGFGPRTTIMQLALGSEVYEPANLYVPHSEPKNAVVVPTTDGLDLDLGAVVSITSTTIDRIAANLARCDFIKIDAEGSEERIYRGMQATISRHRPMIVMEFNVARYRDPKMFIERMAADYGQLWAINFDGSTSPVTGKQLVDTRVGEDWLIVMAGDRPL